MRTFLSYGVDDEEGPEAAEATTVERKDAVLAASWGRQTQSVSRCIQYGMDTRLDSRDAILDIVVKGKKEATS